MRSATAISAIDEREIEAMIYEFAWLVDNGQADQVYALFVEGASMSGVGPQELIGLTAIRAWGDERANLQRVTRHICSNLRITEVDEGRARAASCFSLYRHDGELPGSTVPVMIGDCIDDVSRGEDGRWRIAKRQVNAIFPAAPSAVPVQR